MPRYLIERTFQDNIDLPGADHGDIDRQAFIENNTIDGVTWVYSYIDPNRKKSYCIYDAASPEALRSAAKRNRLPIDRITEINVLVPYAYLPKEQERK